MLSRRRPGQIAYNERTLDWLAKAAGARFWGWEIVVMFYGIAIALDGYAAAKGHPAPKSHRERRAVEGCTCRTLSIRMTPCTA